MANLEAIADIQRRTRSVCATMESAVERVRSGAELAAQAGEEAAQAAQLKSLTERLEQEIGRFRL